MATVDDFNRLIQARKSNPSIRSVAIPQQQQKQVAQAPQSHNVFGDIMNGIGTVGLHIASGLEQAGGNVADIGLQGTGVVNEIGRNINPFINNAQRDKQRVADFNQIEKARNAIKNTKTVTGEALNPYADYKPTGNVAQDVAQLAGRGLQTGLDATMFVNPARLAGKALLEPTLKTAAKDILGSSLALGTAQGVATGNQVYGQTGDVNKALAEGAQSGVLSTAFQGVLGGLGHTAGHLLSKLGTPAGKIARSTNPASIEKTLQKLNPEMDDVTRGILAKHLSTVKDKKQVQDLLENIQQSKEQIPVEKAVERGAEAPAESPTSTATPPKEDNGTALSRKKEAEAQKQAETAATLSSAKDKNSIDYPTFQAQRDLDEAINKHNEELNQLINSNPDMTPQEIEAAKQAAGEKIAKTLTDMQDARAKSAEAEQGQPSAAPNDKSVEEAAQVQSGTTPVDSTPNTPETPAQTATDAQNGVAPDKQSETPTNSSADAFTAERDNMLAQLEENKGKLKEQGKARKKETGQRAAKGDAAFESVLAKTGDVQAAMKAKMSAQKGEKTKANIEPVEASQEYKTHILSDIQSTDGKMSWEKTNTQNAFQKMWGDVDSPLQDHDIKKIQDYYNTKQDGLGDDVADLLKDNKGTQDDFNLLEEIAGAPRTAMTIADFSAPRQLAVSLARHPIVTTRNYIKSFAHTFSSKKFEGSTDKMAQETDASGKNYSEFMDSVMHIHLPNVAEKAAEESMSSVQLLSRAKGVGKERGKVLKTLSAPIRGYGHVVDASNRGMSSAIANTRYELAKNFIDNAGGVEETNRLFSQKELSDLGEVLNTISGRGGKHGGFTSKHATILSNTLFSGRLWASRLNMLNPYWYFRLSGPARKEALSSLAAFSATGAGVLTALAQIPGVEVGTDPLSADFGKAKIGNTRYSVLGGFEQYPRTIAQMLANKKVNSETGEEKDVTIADVAGNVAEGKLNPLLAFALTIAKTLPSDTSDNPLDRKDEWGQDINLAQKAGEMAIPLNFTGMAATSADVGDPIIGTLMNLPSFFGTGVQTYGSTPSNLATEAKDVTQAAQKLSTDSKKAQSAYKKTLSKEDLALVDLSEEKLNTLKDQGTINQDRIDDILRKKKTLDSVSKGNNYDVPKGVTDSSAVEVYKKFNSMSKKDQEYWLSDKNAPDGFSESITEKLNADRTKGLKEFKPSNALAKLYADHQKDLQTSTDLSELDKVNKEKKFQSDAAKLNYSTGVRDLYTEGASDDTKSLLSNGGVSKADLDEAIDLDNQLYSSGLAGSLKFSKKFRTANGYGTPANPDGTSGGSGSSKSAHLSDYLLPNSVGGSKTSALPKFSPKARTTKKIGVNSLPGKSGKKVSIKL